MSTWDVQAVQNRRLKSIMSSVWIRMLSSGTSVVERRMNPGASPDLRAGMTAGQCLQSARSMRRHRVIRARLQQSNELLGAPVLHHLRLSRPLITPCACAWGFELWSNLVQ